MIRPARHGDLPTLRAIQQASLAEPWPDLLEPAVDGPPVALVVTGGDGAPTGTESHDTPLGYAVAIPEGDSAYVAEVAVAPDHRGAGHGTALVSALLDRLAVEGFETARLTVRESDRRARSFYDDLGFRVRSLLPNHYADDDALVLVRSL